MPTKDHIVSCEVCGMDEEDAVRQYGHRLIIGDKTNRKQCWACLEVNDPETFNAYYREPPPF